MINLRPLAVSAATLLAIAIGTTTPSAAGDYSGDFMIKAGVSGVLPNSKFDGLSLNGTPFLAGDIAEVDDSWVPSLTLTYFVNKNIGVELFCCFAQHGVEGKGPVLGGADLGETTIFPPILSLQYHFDGIKGIKPYIGAGVQFIHFFDESSEIGGNLEIDSAFGFSLQGGVDVELGSGWYAGADVRYTWLDTEATFTNVPGLGRLETDFDLDPLIVSAHVGYRFNLFNREPAPYEALK
ncbi:MAG: outer membrane beta-barrel protein [Alphaproteobacteria bacterium]|nr:outer membrane beta-barrel protein [Alphaproteobacteria bacterium]